MGSEEAILVAHACRYSPASSTSTSATRRLLAAAGSGGSSGSGGGSSSGSSPSSSSTRTTSLRNTTFGYLVDVPGAYPKTVELGGQSRPRYMGVANNRVIGGLLLHTTRK